MKKRREGPNSLSCDLLCVLIVETQLCHLRERGEWVRPVKLQWCVVAAKPELWKKKKILEFVVKKRKVDQSFVAEHSLLSRWRRHPLVLEPRTSELYFQEEERVIQNHCWCL